MLLKILHISDLHFRTNSLPQDIVISALTKKIQALSKTDDCPNMLIVTGDVAFGGKADEYAIAKQFIDKIIMSCGIDLKNVFFIPGNHDVDRSKLEPKHIKWWYSNLKSEQDLVDVLTSPEALGKINSTTKAYFEFVKEFMTGKITIGKYGEFFTTIPFGNRSIRLIGLNSAMLCGYDDDDRMHLAVGLDQVSSCIEDIDENDIVISCVHHPFDCFYQFDKPSLSLLQTSSDLILSGHVHEPANSCKIDPSHGQTIFVTAGAGFDRRTTQNGFNIIRLDSDDLSGAIKFFKYMPNEHVWILDKDINRDDANGIYNFKLKKEITGKSSGNGFGQLNTYQVTLGGKLEEMNREQFAKLESVLKDVLKDVKMSITKIESGSIKLTIASKNKLESSILEIAGREVITITEQFDTTISHPDSSVYHWKTFIKPDYVKSIDGLEVLFTHSRVDHLSLRDLFVAPNLAVVSLGEGKDKVQKVVSSNDVLNKIPNQDLRAVIYGVENSGKTTLLKWWYERYYQAGYVPVLLSGEQFGGVAIAQINKVVQREFEKQYTGVIEGHVEKFDRDRILILIDNFDKVRISKTKYKAVFISNLLKGFKNVILSGNDLMEYDEIYSSESGLTRNVFQDFSRYRIAEFGPVLRHELVSKWNGLGQEQLTRNELIKLNNDAESQIESIIGKNFVPSYPIYLLTILQAQEITHPSKPEFSIHGFYYELLINDALRRAVKNKDDISLYYNFITDYCWFLFESQIGLSALSLDDFLTFHSNYSKEYDIRISPKFIIETLDNSKLISVEEDKVSISYRYVYYFYVARYLANNISKPDIKVIVRSLCQRVHRDEFASIVMFLTHLSKDQFILNELVESSKSMFAEYKPARLESDVLFINSMIKQLPEQIYLPLDVEEVKQEELREAELLDQREKQFDSAKDLVVYDINEDISRLDEVSTIAKAMKTLEILGQVTKKYWGELKAVQKYTLTEETYMLGLRTLSALYRDVEKGPELLIQYLTYVFKRKKKKFSREDIENASRHFLFDICTMAAFGTVRRVSTAVGYDKLFGTFEEIAKQNKYNAVDLINVSVSLDQNKSFPFDEIKILKERNDKNYLASTVLRQLVIDYLHMYVTSDKDKDRICQLLGIKIEQQLMIDAVSKVKRESV